MRLALAQINSVVGDLDGNRDRILERLAEAKERGADLVLFPELAVTGYPPEDLLLRPGFVRAAERALEEIARATRNIVALVGVPILERDLYNACAVCTAGEVKALYRKRFLPDYGEKNGFREIVVGVSGGIDSALVAALAAEALSPERVHCVSMPSQFSSEATRADARPPAEGAGGPFLGLPIGPIVA